MFSRLSIIGSTGSIGTQTLAIVRRFPERFRVVALSAGSRIEDLAAQVVEFRPEVVHLGDATRLDELRALLTGFPGGILCGEAGLVQLASEVDADLVVVATVGYTGLPPTLAALRAGRHIALANKEVLVCGGDLVMPLARDRGLHVLPLDSEHNAIWQCLEAGPIDRLRRIILTCSGGPFRDADHATMDAATAAQSSRHPTWTMGRKITVDSATLMNKGFEVIEAHHLFGLGAEKIEVVIHPQSVIHSMVEFVDGSMIAQLGVTDMRLPIQHVLTWPERLPTDLPPLDFRTLSALTFTPPDTVRFPCLGMAFEALRNGGTQPCLLNAANEVAVAAHLEDRITCGQIWRVIRQVLDTVAAGPVDGLESLREADRIARLAAEDAVRHYAAAAPAV